MLIMSREHISPFLLRIQLETLFALIIMSHRLAYNERTSSQYVLLSIIFVARFLRDLKASSLSDSKYSVEGYAQFL
jgi:hypothetical protein